MLPPPSVQFNPDTSFRNLTRPAVIKTTGVMIQPARLSKGTVRGSAGGTTVNASTGVAVVAGGMMVQARGEKRAGGGKGGGGGISGAGGSGGGSGRVEKQRGAVRGGQKRGGS